MTTLFDGVATLLGDILGDVVSVSPAVGAPFEIHAVFREEPIRVLDGEGGSVLVMASTLCVTASRAGLLSEGDEVQVPGGRVFTIVNRQPKGSPAVDAEVIFELEEIAS